MPEKDPTERIRVKDKDTGYDRTVPRSELALGNYQELKQDALDASGADLPPDYHLDGAAAPAAATPKESDR